MRPVRVSGLAWTKTLCATLPLTALLLGNIGHAADLSASFTWAPVRLGAGGFVSGFASHPLDATVRYCRTDVGNAYRWDNTKLEWFPMVVRSGTSGLPASITAAPEQGGVISLGLDPKNKTTVYMAYSGGYSADVSANYPAVPGNIYKSTDGGVTFTAGDLNVSMSPNSDDKFEGERIAVDPNNSNNVYYGSEQNGLWQSTNGGAHWFQVTGAGAPSTSSKISRIIFTTGATYVVQWDGSVYQSTNGGSSWTNISSGTGLDGHAGNSTSDPSGAIYVIQDGSRYIWKYSGGSWTSILSDIAYEQNINGIAVDPSVANGQRIYVIGGGGEVAVTNDGGKNNNIGDWGQWGNSLQIGNGRDGTKFSWLPQPAGYRNTAGIFLDASGMLWVPEGNEGMLSYKPTGSEGWNTAVWTIDSKGIEEFVTHDVIVPPGGNPVVAVEDSTALYVNNPSTLTAVQATLQNQLISDGTGLAYCPNAPLYVAAASADVNHTSSGATYSGYSTDGGKTWANFGSEPATAPVAGSIAVSLRNGWGLGSDHLVYLPTDGEGPYYSKNGGASWTKSMGFPDGDGYWNFSLKQRQLKADPFVADRFYCEATWNGGFYISTDGGMTWTLQTNAGLPSNCHHGQLATNRNIQNDLWFVDGWEGASAHGLWHSTNGGSTFTQVTGIDNAITVAVGAGSGKTGDAASTTYFYGKLTGDANWGVFRSTNGGTSWDRVSYYPNGLVDQPTCLAASWDTFGTIYVGFNGNSFVYATLNSASGETVMTTQTPAVTGANDGTTYELGMKFKSGVAGQVTALRFWKDANDTVSHTGHLWSASGSLLGSVAFTNETASGWQTQLLSSPISISANTTYVVSVNTGGYFVDTQTGLASSIVNGDLSSIADGNDGLFGSSGAFPTSSYNNSNYFRDIVFTPASSSTTSSFSDVTGNFQAINGTHGGINFGSGAWAADLSFAGLGPCGYFSASGVTSSTFTLPSGKYLKSIQLSGDLGGTYSISDGVNTAKTGSITTNTPITVNTGWTSGGSTITVYFSEGWDSALTNITY